MLCESTAYTPYYYVIVKPNGTDPRPDFAAIAVWISAGFAVVIFCVVILVVVGWHRRRYSRQRRSPNLVQTERTNIGISTGFAPAVATSGYGTVEPVVMPVTYAGTYTSVTLPTASAVAIPVASSTLVAEQQVPIATAVSVD